MKHFAKRLAAWALTLALVGSLTSPVTHAVTTSPTVIWLNPDGTLGGKTAVHSPLNSPKSWSRLATMWDWNCLTASWTLHPMY